MKSRLKALRPAAKQGRRATMAKSADQGRSRLGLWLARVTLSESRRVAIYRRLASRLEQGDSLPDALRHIWSAASRDGRKHGDSGAVAVAIWHRHVYPTGSLAHAVRDWGPSHEAMLIATGEQGASLATQLRQIVAVSAKLTQIREAILGATLMPIGLLAMIGGLLAFYGIEIIPQMTRNLMTRGAVTHFTGAAAQVLAASDFMAHDGLYVVAGLISLAALVVWSLPNWTGRARVFADAHVFPWTLYRIREGAAWLVATTAMVTAGRTPADAAVLLRTQATPYLRERIDAMMPWLRSGKNLGVALQRTGLEWPEYDIIVDLRSLEGTADSAQQLTHIAEHWLDITIKTLALRTKLALNLSLLVVALVFAWFGNGIFALMGQMTTALTYTH